jgi:Fe2+ or Zn2+ uptake regulation protein
MGIKSWAMEVKEELHNIGLAFVWRNQQECNWKEMLRLMKERCSDIERQNMLAKFPDKSSLTLYRELNFSEGQKVVHRMLFKKRKEWNSVANSRDMATERSQKER